MSTAKVRDIPAKAENKSGLPIIFDHTSTKVSEKECEEKVMLFDDELKA